MCVSYTTDFRRVSIITRGEVDRATLLDQTHNIYVFFWGGRKEPSVFINITPQSRWSSRGVVACGRKKYICPHVRCRTIYAWKVEVRWRWCGVVVETAQPAVAKMSGVLVCWWWCGGVVDAVATNRSRWVARRVSRVDERSVYLPYGWGVDLLYMSWYIYVYTAYTLLAGQVGGLTHTSGAHTDRKTLTREPPLGIWRVSATPERRESI